MLYAESYVIKYKYSQNNIIDILLIFINNLFRKIIGYFSNK